VKNKKRLFWKRFYVKTTKQNIKLFSLHLPSKYPRWFFYAMQSEPYVWYIYHLSLSLSPCVVCVWPVWYLGRPVKGYWFSTTSYLCGPDPIFFIFFIFDDYLLLNDSKFQSVLDKQCLIEGSRSPSYLLTRLMLLMILNDYSIP
jgi:hypothetical protein